MAYKAKLTSMCFKCGNTITPGQFIAHDRNDGRTGRYRHHDCQNPNVTPWSVTKTPAPLPEGATASGALGVPSQPASTGISEVELRKMVRKMVRDEAFLTITIERANAEPKVLKGVHTLFPLLLYYVQQGHHTYLWGAPGGGKSHAASQVAEALDRKYGYISLNPQTPASQLMGYLDANGVYRSTVFAQLYEHGGVFCIDEMDNASPALLTSINSALENNVAAFPHGNVPRHPDFVMVATGNTAGRGATRVHADRRMFDGATAERFTYIQWYYDRKLERALTMEFGKGDEAKTELWLNWVWNVRDFCDKEVPYLVVSPRAAFKGARYITDKDCPLGVKEVAEAVLFKGLDADTVRRIVAAAPFPKV